MDNISQKVEFATRKVYNLFNKLGRNKTMNKKYIAPIVITAILLLYCIGLIVIFLCTLQFETSFFVFLMLLIGPLAAGIVLIVVLVQRIKEIKGGEEDEASKY